MSPFGLSIDDSKRAYCVRNFLGETRENSLRELIIGNNFDYAPCIFYSCFRVLISFTLDEEEKMSGLVRES